MPLEPTTVPPHTAPVPPPYVPTAPGPSAPPPSGLRARMRARRAGARGALLGHDVGVDVAPGARLEVGEGAAIGSGTRLHVRGGTVRIGAGAVLGERCMLVAHAGIEVGAGAVIGDEAVIVDFAPRYDDVERPVRQQGIVAEPVHIGAGARIGARAAVQRGVVIGERAEVGPLSVVTRDAAPGARVGGVPAQAPAPLRPPRPTGRGTRGGSRSPRDR